MAFLLFISFSSLEAHRHVHMKHQLLVQVGPTPLVATTVKLEHQGIVVLLMVYLLPLTSIIVVIIVVIVNFFILNLLFLLLLFDSLVSCYLCINSQCSKPLFAINSWWAAYDSKFSIISSRNSWRAADDTRHWWFRCYVSCHRSELQSTFSFILLLGITDTVVYYLIQ